ncbi:MAG: alpha/beta hydrolase [Coprococcus sp.]|nr:alpha/beta hydrolase [Coprococcus sp.]
MSKKLCVVFPGIGYHSDKPLLYYGKKYMAEHGYDIVEVHYGKLPKGLDNAFIAGYDVAEQQLKNVDFDKPEDIVFISKSIGTVIAAKYTRQYSIDARNIYFTPLLSTIKYANTSCIAFHGTADPLADTCKLIDACKEKNIPLYTYEGGNHSIETGDILWNMETLKDIAEKYIEYLKF